MTKAVRYYYSAFGLEIGSELEIPELPLSSENKPSVSIILGKVPQALEEPLSEGVCFQALPGKLLLRVDKVARYLVKNGAEIIIEPDHNSTPGEVSLFLLGSVFGALLHQRGLLPIHGSALAHENQAVIISGLSGAGKSTIAAALCKNGFRLLADDISVITFGEMCAPIVLPAYPQLKLWTDSLHKLGESVNSYIPVRSNLQKFAVPAQSTFSPRPVKLSLLYALSSRNNDGYEINTLKGIEKFNILKNNTYRFPFLHGLNLQPQHFALCSSLAERIVIKKLIRSSKGFHLDKLVTGLREDILETFAKTGQIQINPG